MPQKAVLFHGTIRDNLLWGNADATEDELCATRSRPRRPLDVRARQAAAGWMSRSEQGGRNFSGGQRQRLTIARALVRKPEILILDDSASALDFATDASAAHAPSARLDRPPTAFIVSQRAASVRFADQILVLDDGRVAGMGTHDELLAACPVYQEIYASQFTKEGNRDGATTRKSPPCASQGAVHAPALRRYPRARLLVVLSLALCLISVGADAVCARSSSATRWICIVGPGAVDFAALKPRCC